MKCLPIPLREFIKRCFLTDAERECLDASSQLFEVLNLEKTGCLCFTPYWMPCCMQEQLSQAEFMALKAVVHKSWWSTSDWMKVVQSNFTHSASHLDLIKVIVEGLKPRMAQGRYLTKEEFNDVVLQAVNEYTLGAVKELDDLMRREFASLDASYGLRR